MKATVVSFLLAVTAVTTLPDCVAAQAVPAAARNAAEPIQYTVSFPAPHTHYAEITAVVPTSRRPTVELMMAVWTPGSYLVREFERNVENVAATAAGRALAIAKSDKNRWRIATTGAPTIEVRYRVYGREMSVRTNWIDAGFALLNGAPTFLTLTDGLARPHDVTIVPAQGWAKSFTPMPAAGGTHRYRAADFDTLVDSPILVGNAAAYEFTVDGKRHLLVNEGEAGVFDGAMAARDLEAIVRECRRVWGFLPYDRYVFFNLLTERSGGLEHKDSTVLMASRWATRTRAAYVSWLELASHELLHAWNVKRLRPVELGPFNYEQEVTTRSLWIAEGITDYFADLVVARAGLSSRDQLLNSLWSRINELQTSPGRLVQSAEQASFDAWIKYYRPDENSNNTTISYYTKGALLGFLLDAKVRKASGGKRTLEDVMIAAYQKYSGERGYTPEEFRAVAEQVAGVSLAEFWATAVAGTADLDYSEALQVFGLRFGPAPERASPWLGVTTRNEAGRLLVSQVRRESPAEAAGINVDDEIIAIDDFRILPERLDARLDQYRAGDRVRAVVARRDQLLPLDVTLGTEPARYGRLTVDPMAAEAAVQQRTRWLAPGS
jgi:predicted metalloprotease with PDZ domain